MLTIHFHPYEDEKEIHKRVAQVEAEYEHAKNYKPVSLPKFIKTPKVKRGVAGWYIFAVDTLKELRP